MKPIPRISTRGYYDLSTGETLKKNQYYLYPKKDFEKLKGSKELTIMIHGLRNDKKGAVAKAVIDVLYQLLLPGGELVIGNFHVSNPSKIFMEYWGDWYLIHRTEEELKELLNSLDPSAVSIIFEETRSQMFIVAKNQTENL